MTRSSTSLAEKRRKTSGLSLTESVAANMRSLARDYTRALERRLAAHNVTISMWFPLRILWEEDGITQNDIREQLALSQPTLAVALDRLERRGLIDRERSEIDRRRIHIYLTREGKDLKKQILRYADEVQSIATESVTERELTTLYKIFSKMRAALENEQATGKAKQIG